MILVQKVEITASIQVHGKLNQSHMDILQLHLESARNGGGGEVIDIVFDLAQHRAVGLGPILRRAVLRPNRCQRTAE